MNAPAVIQAVYTEWKMVKTRSALVLCFEVPLEHQAIVQAVLGTPLQGEATHVAIARLTAEAASRGTVTAPAAQIDPPGRSGSLAQKAGILCNEQAFNTWAKENGFEDGKAYIYKRCGVLSRAELDRNEEAAKAFRVMHTDYKLWLHDPVPVSRTDDREPVGT